MDNLPTAPSIVCITCDVDGPLSGEFFVLTRENYAVLFGEHFRQCESWSPELENFLKILQSSFAATITVQDCMAMCLTGTVMTGEPGVSLQLANWFKTICYENIRLNVLLKNASKH